MDKTVLKRLPLMGISNFCCMNPKYVVFIVSKIDKVKPSLNKSNRIIIYNHDKNKDILKSYTTKIETVHR